MRDLLDPRLSVATHSYPILLYWCDTTVRQTIETGVQRVTRWLGRILGQQSFEVVPVGWDSRHRVVISLSERKLEISRGTWLLVPEHPMSALADGVDPVQLGSALGVRTAALIHDLIPLRLPDLYDVMTRRMFQRYYRMFSMADLVFATTNMVAQQMREHLGDECLKTPRIEVVPLPAQLGRVSRFTTSGAEWSGKGAFRLLTISTWEPRKNLTTLLRAVSAAERQLERPIELTLIGHKGVYPALDSELNRQAAAMPRVTVLHGISDEALVAQYRSHHASIYPSVEEGFGLPIMESLWLATPCICHDGSSMAEVAPGGGTLMLDMRQESVLADSLVQLVREPSIIGRLASEALRRPLRSWVDYAGDIESRIKEVGNSFGPGPYQPFAVAGPA